VASVEGGPPCRLIDAVFALTCLPFSDNYELRSASSKGEKSSANQNFGFAGAKNVWNRFTGSWLPGKNTLLRDSLKQQIDWK